MDAELTDLYGGRGDQYLDPYADLHLEMGRSKSANRNSDSIFPGNVQIGQDDAFHPEGDVQSSNVHPGRGRQKR